MYALIDCNNFYASCEQVFDPSLIGQPLVILSNNDGCVIARSNEAKKLNIKVGDPIFTHKSLIDTKMLLTKSSNFSLYGDMSSRVMQLIDSFGFTMEIYSIDEAFITLNINMSQIKDTAEAIRNKIQKWSGISTSIGIGKTKTLAKLAASIAKKTNGVHLLEDSILRKTALIDIWGIGKGLNKKFQKFRIFTAKQLIDQDNAFLQKYFGIMGLRLALELRGICAVSSEAPVRKSIICSKTFPQKKNDLEDLQKSIASFAVSACKRLRSHKKCALSILVFLSTSPFEKNHQYDSCFFSLANYSDFNPDFIHLAKLGIKKMYKKNINYKRAGITILDLCDKNNRQLSFVEKSTKKKDTLIATFDQINIRYGKNSLYHLAQEKPKNKSPRYTTSLSQIPIAYAK